MGSGYALDLLLRQQFEGKDQLSRLAIYKDNRLTPVLYQIIEDMTGYVKNRDIDEKRIHAAVINGIGGLGQLHGSMADNMLNLAIQLPDYRFEYDPYGSGGSWRRVCFDEERHMAQEALAARGNPPYNPEAYMRPDVTSS